MGNILPMGVIIAILLFSRDQILTVDPVVEGIYLKAKKSREIHSLPQARTRLGWKLEEVKETLFRYYGRALKYYLVSSTVDGGYIEPEDKVNDFEWWQTKFMWRQHKKEVFMTDKVHKYSDFDVNVSFLNDKPTGYSGGIVTPSGLKIDMYPHKGERAILINPEIKDIIQELDVNPYELG